MAVQMKCINCGIALKCIQKFALSSLPDTLQKKLKSWLSVQNTDLSFDGVVCKQCYLMVNSENSDSERLLGHTIVCYGCGVSLLRAKRHRQCVLEPESPIYSVITSWNNDYPYLNKSRICHACARRAESQLKSLTNPTLTRLSSTYTCYADTNSPHKKNVEIQTVTTDAIHLPGYRRSGWSSTKCFLKICSNQKTLQRLPQKKRASIMYENQLFISKNARVCDKHISISDYIDELLQEATNSFTGEHIKEMLDLHKIYVSG